MSADDAPAGAALKERARAHWQQAAEAWYRWTPTLTEWLEPVTRAMMDAARIAPGHRVLDVAAGAGEPSVTIARRVGAGGSVLATDISPAILELAACHAAGARVENVQTRVMDGEALDLPESSFDAAVSRLGVIYLPDRVEALRQIRRVLRPGARVAIVGITSPAANPFSAVTMGVLGPRAKLPPPPPGGPGPFSMGSEAAMRGPLEEAGFADVAVEVVDAPLAMASARECARMQREAFAGLDQMLAALPPAERDDAWEEVARQLARFEGGGSFRSAAQFIVGSGAKPG